MSGSSLGASIPILSFDPIEQIMFVGFAGLKVETAPQIKVIFDTIDGFWTRRCAPDRVYGVIDYTNFSLNMALTSKWAERVKYGGETYSIATIRFTSDLSARATMRAVAVKTHQPSNLYLTREDAIAVVRGLRSKRIFYQSAPGSVRSPRSAAGR
jgi:hypothetical protein